MCYALVRDALALARLGYIDVGQDMRYCPVRPSDLVLDAPKSALRSVA